MWKESIVSFETPAIRDGSVNPAGAALPADIGNMVQNNNSLIRSVQGSFDRRLQSLTDQFGRQGKPGKGKSKGGKNGKRADNNGSGNGGTNSDNGNQGKGTKRKITWGLGTKKGRRGNRKQNQ